MDRPAPAPVRPPSGEVLPDQHRLIPLALKEGFIPERIRVQPRAGEEIIERISTSADGAAAYLPSLFTSESQAPRRVLSAGAFGEAIAEYARGYHEFVTLFEEALRGDALGEARSA